MAGVCSEEFASKCLTGCCRVYAQVEYCEVQSNCVINSNWMAIAVPVMLAICGFVLLVMIVLRLTKKRVVDRYEFIRKHSLSPSYQRNQTTPQLIKDQ